MTQPPDLPPEDPGRGERVEPPPVAPPVAPSASPYQPPPAPNAGGYPAVPPPAAYPAPGGVAPAVGASNQKAIWSLVLGILAVLGCCGVVLGTVALVIGNQARNEIRASAGAQSGDGMAVAGMITGGVGIVLSLVWIPIWLALAATN